MKQGKINIVASPVTDSTDIKSVMKVVGGIFPDLADVHSNRIYEVLRSVIRERGLLKNRHGLTCCWCQSDTCKSIGVHKHISCPEHNAAATMFKLYG